MRIAGILLALTIAAHGAENARAVATFESLGLYYDRPPAADGCNVWYRIAGDRLNRVQVQLVRGSRQ